MIKLGSKVKDSLTGFKGIAVGHATFMYGCARIQIEPEELDKDGTCIEPLWFDDQRVEVIQVKKPTVSKTSSSKKGGPQKDATRGRAL